MRAKISMPGDLELARMEPRYCVRQRNKSPAATPTARYHPGVRGAACGSSSTTSHTPCCECGGHCRVVFDDQLSCECGRHRA